MSDDRQRHLLFEPMQTGGLLLKPPVVQRAVSRSAPATRTFYSKDLTGFLACRHLTTLERLAAAGAVRRPHFEDPMLEILQERGLAHEGAYVEHLRAQGKRVVEIRQH